MPSYYTPLPAFRTPEPLDFRGLNEGIDSYLQGVERNRLLQQNKNFAQGLLKEDPQTSSSSPQYAPTNRLLSNSSPAQYGAANAREFLKQQEGYAPVAQWDRRQNSGGYGSKAAPGETFTQEKAEQYLTRDMSPVEQWIERNIPNATPEQKTGLISFGYNLGTDDLDRLKPDMLAGNWDRVAQRMPTFNKALNNQTGQLEVLPALTDRRNREAALVRGGAPSPVSAPAAASQAPSRLNYAEGMRVAASQGNVDAMLKLQALERDEEQNAYTRQRQTTQDAQTRELNSLTIEEKREELQKLALTKSAAAAQTVAAEKDPAKRQDKLSRFLRAKPEMASILQNYGVDPNDPDAVANFLVGQVRELTPAKSDRVEVNGRLIERQPDGSWKSVYDSPPKPAQLTAGDRTEIIKSDEAIQAGRNAVASLQKALELNEAAYAGPTAATRGYVTSVFGNDSGEATEKIDNIVKTQALDQLKAVFGGNPTEGERQILLDIQGSSNKSREVRKDIWERAIIATERRIKFNQAQANAMRSGEYYAPGFSPVTPEDPLVQNPAPSQGSAGASGRDFVAPPAAVQFLQSNPSPEIIAQFDAKYGQGAAQRALSQTPGAQAPQADPSQFGVSP